VPWGFGGIIVAVVGTEVAVMKQSPKSDRVGGKVGGKARRGGAASVAVCFSCSSQTA